MEGCLCEKLDILDMPGNQTDKIAKFTTTDFIIGFCSISISLSVSTCALAILFAQQ